MKRQAKINRKTAETDIALSLDIDGDGGGKVQSGNGFMDHMLTLFTRHGLFSLDVRCVGDTHVDFHHSIEDIGICLGKAIDKALHERRGITRFGTAYVPMDESLARVCCDLSGRSTLVYQVELVDRVINDFECDLAYDFFKAVTDNAGMTLHVDLLRGRNSHHSLEAVFKGFGRALSQACAVNPRSSSEVPSTKGVL
ncbi:MAG: imidazoleglycerol-phosphate dehydratase HisB [Chitinivibrionales bacterium]|nr:imidazoleglycerol-phosphate dehydratase HisB [Chitinivibrionales bacterium]